MKLKNLLILYFLIFSFTIAQAVDTPEEESVPEDSSAIIAKQIEESFNYETGEIDLMNGLAKLTVPKGYKFLNGKQSQYVLSTIWGNPEDSSTLGLLFPENTSPISNFTYAIEITYSEDGFIDDEDAQDLDYDDLLEEMQTGANEANPQRKAMGYPEVQLVGWAAAPFYDEAKKKLHWAKELHFEGSEANTLNYNVRILGRKGYINMNVIGDMSTLPEVQKGINNIISSAEFKDGNKYSDFNPSVDKVAAYGIGGLIAGKVLAKAGFFVLLLKFWKFIAIGLVALGAMVKKFFFGEKNPYTKEEGQ